MPIGLVSDLEFEKELESHLPVSQKRVPSSDPSNERGRKEGDVNVPESLRKIIGETSVIDGRQSALELASQFGISASSVSAYAVGATSTKTYDSPSQEIVKHINKSRARAVKKASHVLNSALAAVTQEKLDYTDARDLSGIAKDMSVIIKNLEPQHVPDEGNAKQTPQFILYAPTFRDERTFETITVQE